MLFKIMNCIWLQSTQSNLQKNIERSVSNLGSQRGIQPYQQLKQITTRIALPAKVWNVLPDGMKYEKSMEAFKHKLD